MRRPRLGIGPALLLIATLAVVFAVLRPTTERQAVEIATRQFLRDLPEGKRGEIWIDNIRWDAKKGRWVLFAHQGICFADYEVGWFGDCQGSGVYCL